MLISDGAKSGMLDWNLPGLTLSDVNFRTWGVMLAELGLHYFVIKVTVLMPCVFCVGTFLFSSFVGSSISSVFTH